MVFYGFYFWGQRFYIYGLYATIFSIISVILNINKW